MSDLRDLQDVMDILSKQEEMLNILEDQQKEIEAKKATILSLKEQLDEAQQLNETLNGQNSRLLRQNSKLQEQIKALQKQIECLKSSVSR